MRGGLLNETDVEEICCEESPRQKAEAFLSILTRKGPKAFVAFVKALQEVQSHLSEPFLKAAGLPEVTEHYVHELDDVTPGKLTENTQVDKLPESVRSLLCVHLNADNAFGDNWERVYKDAGLPMDQIDRVKSQKNPTDCTLSVWHGRMGSKATVGKLLDILRNIPRMDVVEILQNAMQF